MTMRCSESAAERRVTIALTIAPTRVRATAVSGSLGAPHRSRLRPPATSGRTGAACNGRVDGKRAGRGARAAREYRVRVRGDKVRGNGGRSNGGGGNRYRSGSVAGNIRVRSGAKGLCGDEECGSRAPTGLSVALGAAALESMDRVLRALHPGTGRAEPRSATVTSLRRLGHERW